MRHAIKHQEVETYTDELAWKRSGFKDRQALEQAVRDLSPEKKIKMLIEVNINAMAEKLFTEKQTFLLNLGHKTWVDAVESYEYAKKTYTGDEWEINEHDFHPICVFYGIYTNQMNADVLDRARTQRKKK